MRDAAFRFVAASWLLLTLALLPVVVSDTSDVVTLTDSNFDGLTKEGSWMIEFYAPSACSAQPSLPPFLYLHPQL